MSEKTESPEKGDLVSNDLVINNKAIKDVDEDSQEPGTNWEGCGFETAISATGYGKYNVLLLLASVTGFFGCINTTSTISLILPSAECDLDLSNFDKGIMNAISYIGMISCAFLWGFLSDTLGRKNLLVIAFFLDSILSLIVGLAQNFTLLVVAKLISGCVSAGPYAILMAYLAECHHSKYRASILIWTGMFSAIATICLPAVAWIVIPQPIHINLFGWLSLPSWRIFLLVSCIPSLLACILLSFFSESPKFLMSRGRTEEAMEIFRRIYQLNTGKPKETYPVKSLAEEVGEEGKKDVSFLQQGMSQVKPIFHKPYLSNAILIFVIQFGSLAGLNTMRLWSPQLFSMMLDMEKNPSSGSSPTTVCQLLFPNTTSAILNTTQISEAIHCTQHFVESRVYINSMIIGAVSGIGYFGSGYLVKILGKKKLMVTLNMIAGLSCIGMYWSPTSDLMLGGTSIFITMTSISCTTAISVVVDLYPTTLRTMAVSLTMMSGRTGAMVGNLTFPLLLDWNCTTLFFLISAVIVGTGLLSLLLPKTKGAPLK